MKSFLSIAVAVALVSPSVFASSATVSNGQGSCTGCKIEQNYEGLRAQANDVLINRSSISKELRQAMEQKRAELAAQITDEELLFAITDSSNDSAK